ncbi:unnamed protein product [Strongylus vulgaris]|uniref:Uncharacterized protein n=1 Tax=Strongylus vulgaris TaxID=40348 RepID=A0A3P7JQZ1_STRVU|nr:unnamed protein product [Strongylus vulgaris]
MDVSMLPVNVDRALYQKQAEKGCTEGDVANSVAVCETANRKENLSGFRTLRVQFI